MRKRILLAVTVVALLVYAPVIHVQTPSQVHAAQPLAMLIVCKGDVKVVRNGGVEVMGTFGLQLEAGDEVRTGADSGAEILFENDNLIAIGANSSMVVKGQKTDANTAVADKSFQVVQNFLKLKDAEGTRTLAQLRSGAKEEELNAVSPQQTKIIPGRPTFHWNTSDAAAELKLTLYDEAGVVWKQNVKGDNKTTYPADAQPLAAGASYSWTLETTDPLRYPPLRTSAAFFEILAQDDAGKLNASLAQVTPEARVSKSSYHILRASLYFEYGLMEEAIEETRMALENDPDNPTLHSILARLYAETGRTDEAIGEYDRLLEEN